jgi:hypothetical protein
MGKKQVPFYFSSTSRNPAGAGIFILGSYFPSRGLSKDLVRATLCSQVAQISQSSGQVGRCDQVKIAGANTA